MYVFVAKSRQVRFECVGVPAAYVLLVGGYVTIKDVERSEESTRFCSTEYSTKHRVLLCFLIIFKGRQDGSSNGI